MKIVLYSSWFPVCVATYLARAARRLDLDVVTCGKSSGSSMPWPGCERRRYSAFVPDFATVDEALESKPDVWIDVDGAAFADRVLPIPRLLVATDPHIAAQGAHWTYRRQRELVGDPAHVFVMQSPYTLDGERWLPYAFDPEWFKPCADVKVDHDVTILGAPYPERRRIAFALRERGLRVLGPGFGGIGMEHARELCRAPTAVVWPMADDLPCRVFEALACGRVVVTRGVPDALRLPDVFRACGLVETIENVVDMASSVSADPRIVSPFDVSAHSWDARMRVLVDAASTAR